MLSLCISFPCEVVCVILLRVILESRIDDVVSKTELVDVLNGGFNWRELDGSNGVNITSCEPRITRSTSPLHQLWLIYSIRRNFYCPVGAHSLVTPVVMNMLFLCIVNSTNLILMFLEVEMRIWPQVLVCRDVGALVRPHTISNLVSVDLFWKILDFYRLPLKCSWK